MRIRLTDYHVRFQGENRRGGGISFDREGGQFRAEVTLPPQGQIAVFFSKRSKSTCTAASNPFLISS
jgi:hypothetical protein